MTWNPRPIPDVTPETEPYWTAAAEGELLVQECGSCGLVFHYPRTVCPDCFTDDISWIESAGVGEIYSYSVTEQASGWPDEYLPLILAYVELDEGPRMMTNIVETDPANVEVGSRVRVLFEPVDDEEIAIPVWTVV